jgi:tetratricopeptide (TPR) repeat protein
LLNEFIANRFYKKKGYYDKAIEDYNKIIELKPDFADAYVSRGNTYYNKSKYDLAIADYQKAVKIDPNHRIAKDNLEMALKKKVEQQP